MRLLLKPLLTAIVVSFATVTWNQPVYSEESNETHEGGDQDGERHDNDNDRDGDRNDDDSRLGLILGTAGIAAGGLALYMVSRDQFSNSGAASLVKTIDDSIPDYFFLNTNIAPEKQSFRIGIRY